jgi:hypothetical protein
MPWGQVPGVLDDANRLLLTGSARRRDTPGILTRWKRSRQLVFGCERMLRATASSDAQRTAGEGVCRS